MRYSWKDLMPALLVICAAPWLAAMLFAAFVGARHYVPGFLEYVQMWRRYSPSTPRISRGQRRFAFASQASNACEHGMVARRSSFRVNVEPRPP